MEGVITYLWPIIASLLCGMGAFVMKNIFNRLEVLEDKMNKTVTEQDVRTILSDKIDPLKEDVHEIKQAIVKIYELYLAERK